MIAYRDAMVGDGPALAAVAKRVFTDTFGTLYRPHDLATFLDSAFGPSGLPAQIGDPAYRIRLAVERDAAKPTPSPRTGSGVHLSTPSAAGGYAEQWTPEQVRGDASNDTILGFAKIGPVVFPGDWPDTAIELHQLYVVGDQHGAGIGPALMDWAIDMARGQGATEMALSVYIDNHRARRFYERYGFIEIGRLDFPVGDHIDEDRIMRLYL